ncbi:MAG: class I SAM-dependent methyltransferase, partial [Candidatus Thorarchaeota archaeon]
MPVTTWGVSLEEGMAAVAITQEAAEAEKKEFRVLDVGGAIKPLIFATHIIDILPHHNRAWFGHIAPGEVSRNAERFSADSWAQMDMCETPWPYDDDFFDIVWCTQTIEDVRDPIAVLKEMSRVGKAGYIETIDRNFESLKNAEDPNYAGYIHHRWFIEEDDDKLKFTQKYPIIHVDDKLVPLPTGKKFLNLWWTDDVEGYENIEMSREAILDYFRKYN